MEDEHHSHNCHTWHSTLVHPKQRKVSCGNISPELSIVDRSPGINLRSSGLHTVGPVTGGGAIVEALQTGATRVRQPPHFVEPCPERRMREFSILGHEMKFAAAIKSMEKLLRGVDGVRGHSLLTL